MNTLNEIERNRREPFKIVAHAGTVYERTWSRSTLVAIGGLLHNVRRKEDAEAIAYVFGADDIWRPIEQHIIDKLKNQQQARRRWPNNKLVIF